MSYQEEKSIRRLIIAEWITIAALCCGLFAWSYTTSRMDAIALNERVDAQNARSDQLYVAFYDLLKEKK